ncbi:E3 ubiquitin-protein ligase COP1 [Dendrobium catenatum]|uniref:E3 ubiquitin-protein ligase COP1 n=1 Tax=Dendrobium catenatum TaxID=906689 RepID=A0A2I0VL10_9ASPA|nr:E3 ubiquitin-protein ligase COP1 [Dendrobium catenatum]
MAVQYKFRSSVAFDSVDLSGRSSISVRDLRARISDIKKLKICADFDLVLSDADTGKVFENEDFQIPVGASVVIKRVPTGREATNDRDAIAGTAGKSGGCVGTLQLSTSERLKASGCCLVVTNSSETMGRKEGTPTSSGKPPPSSCPLFCLRERKEQVYALPLGEMRKTRRSPKQKTRSCRLSPSFYATNKVRYAISAKAAQILYKSRRLGDLTSRQWQCSSLCILTTDYHLQNFGVDNFDDFGFDLYPNLDTTIHCYADDMDHFNSSANKKKDVSVRSFEVPNLKGQKIDRSDVKVGENFREESDEGENQKEMNSKNNVELKKKLSEDMHFQVTFNTDLPAELRCSLCNSIFKEAVMIPCCQHSFCNRCIASTLVKQSSCPKCSSTKCTVKDLLPNLSLRQAIEHFLEAQNASIVSYNNLPMYAPGENTEQYRAGCTEHGTEHFSDVAFWHPLSFGVISRIAEVVLLLTPLSRVKERETRRTKVSSAAGPQARVSGPLPSGSGPKLTESSQLSDRRC